MPLNIKQELISYIKSKVNNGALLLTGKWGSGKTYFINNIISQLEDTKDYAIVRLSMFGVDSVSDLKNIIHEKYMEKFFSYNSDNQKIFNKLFQVSKSGINIFTSIFDSNKPLKIISSTLKELETLELFNLFRVKKTITRINIKNKTTISIPFVLVFDDFERSKIDIIERLGLINEFCENLGIKTIIIADEEKIRQNQYDEFKEKIVEKTIHFLPDHDEIINTIIDEFNYNSDYYDFLKQNESLLKTAFEQSKYYNFRSFKSGIKDFERVYNIIYKYNDSLTISKDELLYNFCAITYETKAGNFKKISRYGLFGICLSDKRLSELSNLAEKERKVRVSEEITSIQQKYADNALSLNYRTICEWIVSGEWNELEFKKELFPMKNEDFIPSEIKLLNQPLLSLEQTDLDQGLPIILKKAYEGKLCREELKKIVSVLYQLKNTGLDKNYEIKYEEIINGYKKRKELIKNGVIIEPPLYVRLIRESYIEELSELYDEFDKSDKYIVAWKLRRELLDYFKGKSNESYYSFKDRILDCFDEELYISFINAYDNSTNNEKIELISIITNIFYNFPENEQSNLDKTKKNYERIVNYLKQKVTDITTINDLLNMELSKNVKQFINDKIRKKEV